MAITYINGTTGSFSGYPASPQTIATLDVGTGTDRLITVALGTQSGADNYITSVTVGGVSLNTETRSIVGATKTNPCEITSTAHGLTTGCKIYISGVSGMTQLNGNWYSITVTGTNTFTLNSTDSSAYTTYTSGGVYKVQRYLSVDDYYSLYYLQGASLPTGSQPVVVTFLTGTISILEASIGVWSGTQSIRYINYFGGGTSTTNPSRTTTSTTGDKAIYQGNHVDNTTVINTVGGTKLLETQLGTYRHFILEEPGASSVVIDYTTSLAVFDLGFLFSIEPVSGSSAPTISDAGDETYLNGETGITITGTNFEASQGTGFVKISPTNSISDGAAVTQTINGWGASSINITAVRGALAYSTNMYMFVQNNSGLSNASGYVVQFLPDKKLKVLVHSSAASATGVKGVVFNAPSGAEIAGSEIGEFTGKTFDASLESGQAVLKVNVLDFGGGSLATGATPVVLVRNSTNTTGIISAIIIEE